MQVSAKTLDVNEPQAWMGPPAFAGVTGYGAVRAKQKRTRGRIALPGVDPLASRTSSNECHVQGERLEILKAV
jgi:hypothetical protein